MYKNRTLENIVTNWFLEMVNDYITYSIPTMLIFFRLL